MKTLRALVALVLLLCSACLGCPRTPSANLLEWESVALVRDDGSIYCSGTWVGFERVLTARHCMGARNIGDRVVVMTRDQVQRVGYWTAMEDEHLDLAVLSVWHPPAHHPWASVARSDPQDGDRVYMTGNPIGLGWSYMESVVSSHRPMDVDDGKGLVHMLQIQGPLYAGQSGSAAFNADGEIVGVVVRVKGSAGLFEPPHGIGFAVHREVVAGFLAVDGR